MSTLPIGHEGALARPRVAPRTRALRLVNRALLYAALSLGAFLMVVPFLWMVSTSFKTLDQVFAFPPQWIPNPWVFENYVRAMTISPFHLYFLNTAYIAILVTVGQLFTCSLAGYTFARLRFPGRDALFLTYIATMMIPGMVTIIPVFVVMKTLDLVDTHTAVIVPHLASAFGTFLSRQFYLTMPAELEDAAKIDGSGYFGIYARIFLPLSKPLLATLGVFVFMGQWNDFFWPLIMLQTQARKTLTLGLMEFRNLAFGLAEWHLMMAGAVVALLPILIVFALAQRLFVRGIALSGIKG
jgi:multiple sugar transport system permease protein